MIHSYHDNPGKGAGLIQTRFKDELFLTLAIKATQSKSCKQR